MKTVSRLGALALILALCGVTGPASGTAKPLPLPPGNGSWVAQVIISGGNLHRAQSYYVNSTNAALIQVITPGNMGSPASWNLSETNVSKIGQAIRASNPGRWSMNPVVCCNGTYYELHLVVRRDDGTVHHGKAGWNGDHPQRQAADAVNVAQNVLRAFARARGM